MMAVIIIGIISLVAAFVRLPAERLDVYLFVLAAFTIGLGSRITIQIPRSKVHIAVSDTFVFLALLIYGAEVAIILAAAEAFCSSWRFCNKKFTVFFNAATMAISTTIVVLVLDVAGLYTEGQMHGHADYRTNFIIALSVIAMTQFIANTSLAAIHDALKSSLPLWETWKSKYIWTFFSYFVGAGAAGILVQMSDTIGFGVILATFPVIFFVFLSYRMYMKNVEIVTQQAEQAEQYAKILETQSDPQKRFRILDENASKKCHSGLG